MESPTQGTNESTGSSRQSQGGPPTGTVGGSTGAGSSSGSDIKSIDAELNAMQKEIDGLAMPEDSDFSAAEGALY